MDVLEIERGHVLDLPAEMVGTDFDGLDGRELIPGLGEMSARGKSDFEGLGDDGDGGLDLPVFLVHIGAEVFLGFTNNDGAGVAGGGIDGANALSELEDGGFIGAMVDEVGFHGLELAAVGGEGPGAEVVELFVDVITDGAVGIAAALRLEDANRDALAFHGVVLLIDDNQVFVKEDDGRGVFCGSGGGCLGGFDRPLRGWLRLVFGVGGDSHGQTPGECGGKDEETAIDRRHQLPFPAGAALSTSCC